jgi:hypothetical protein
MQQVACRSSVSSFFLSFLLRLPLLRYVKFDVWGST